MEKKGTCRRNSPHPKKTHLTKVLFLTLKKVQDSTSTLYYSFQAQKKNDQELCHTTLVFYMTVYNLSDLNIHVIVFQYMAESI